eukprot:6196603-Pleurochrysis_carterae.AAC.2
MRVEMAAPARMRMLDCENGSRTAVRRRRPFELSTKRRGTLEVLARGASTPSWSKHPTVRVRAPAITGRVGAKVTWDETQREGVVLVVEKKRSRAALRPDRTVRLLTTLSALRRHRSSQSSRRALSSTTMVSGKIELYRPMGERPVKTCDDGGRMAQQRRREMRRREGRQRLRYVLWKRPEESVGVAPLTWLRFRDPQDSDQPLVHVRADFSIHDGIVRELHACSSKMRRKYRFARRRNCW